MSSLTPTQVSQNNTVRPLKCDTSTGVDIKCYAFHKFVTMPSNPNILLFAFENSMVSNSRSEESCPLVVFV